MIGANSLIILLLIPVVVAISCKIIFHRSFDWKEFGITTAVVCLIVVAFHQVSIKSQMYDTEIWNGAVTDKQKVRVSCSHSYQCNCTTDSDGHESCSTCYEHINDYDWEVYTTAGNFEVSRIDRQGDDMPPRWKIVEKNQPASIEHSFDNYIKAAPTNVINAGPLTPEEQAKYPSYPSVYDYHYVRRAINMPDQKWWDTELANVLRTLGPNKTINIIVVRTTQSMEYAFQLNRAWLGGKKNDAIIIIGTQNNTNIITWVKVIGWAKDPVFNLQLEADILKINSLDLKREILDNIVSNVNKLFIRTKMEEYDYLKHDIDMSPLMFILAMITSVISTIGLTIFFNNRN